MRPSAFCSTTMTTGPRIGDGPAGNVLLYDDHGWRQGPSTAVALARKGVALEVVTPDRMLAFEVGATNYPYHLRQLYRAGVSLTPRSRAAGGAP